MADSTPTVADATIDVVAVESGASVTAIATASQPITRSRDTQVESIAALIRARIRPELAEELQDELAELLDLLPELASPEHQRLMPLADVAAAALLADKPNLKLAKGIRLNLQRRIRRLFNPITVLRGGSPPTRVILGLGTLLYFALPGLFVYGRRMFGQEKVLGLDSSLLILVGLAGALGSIVSIMVRIQDFGKAGDADQSVLFFTGFFKPVIGMSFALFVFAVLSAGILPITIEPEKSRYFFAALGFVSGFSERFATDVASRAEGAIKTSSPLS